MTDAPMPDRLAVLEAKMDKVDDLLDRIDRTLAQVNDHANRLQKDVTIAKHGVTIILQKLK